MFFYGLNYSIKKTNKWSLENINFLAKHYKEELETIKKLSENNKGELLNLLDQTYKFFGYLFILATAFLIIDKINNNILFYSFLGASTSLTIKLIAGLIYNYKLIQKSKNIKHYENKILVRIKNLEELSEK